VQFEDEDDVEMITVEDSNNRDLKEVDNESTDSY